MVSTFIYIIITWFVLGFVAAWLFGYPWRTGIQAGLAGLIVGLTLLAAVLTFNPRLREVFWEDLREDEESIFWWGLYFWLPLVLLGLVVITWLVALLVTFVRQGL